MANSGEKFLCFVLCRKQKLSENEHQCVVNVPGVLFGASAVLQECPRGTMFSYLLEADTSWKKLQHRQCE